MRVAKHRAPARSAARAARFHREDPVIPLAVLSERFAVIAGHDHDRLLGKPMRVERVEEVSNLRVGERDFADGGSP